MYAFWYLENGRQQEILQKNLGLVLQSQQSTI
jgi:hypothetical protein